jgi:hypothetical protein
MYPDYGYREAIKKPPVSERLAVFESSLWFPLLHIPNVVHQSSHSPSVNKPTMLTNVSVSEISPKTIAAILLRINRDYSRIFLVAIK